MRNSIAVIPLENEIQERVGVIESIMLTSEFSVFVSSVKMVIFFFSRSVPPPWHPSPDYGRGNMIPMPPW
jgi:hypothetical protein